MPDDFAPRPFRCSVVQRDSATRLLLEGDLDMSTVEDVERELNALVASGAKQVVVDLRGLTFMDSTGLTMLTRWNNFASRDGFNLALVQGEDRIARLFALTGLREYFTFVAG